MSCASSPRATGRSATAMTRSASLASRSLAASASALVGVGDRADALGRLDVRAELDGLLGRALHVRDQLAAHVAHDRHALARGVERELVATRALGLQLLDVEAGLRRRRPASRPRSDRRGSSTTSLPSAGARRRALLQSTAAARQSSRRVFASPVTGLAVEREGARRARSRRPRPRRVSPGSQTSRTVIWFAVSVPVLSVQMTVVEPSVSTLESFLTSTLRLAMRCAATESAIVSVGSSPSGTLATMMPMAKTTAASVSMPTKILLIAKKKMPRPTAMIEMSLRQPLDVLLQRREPLGDALRQPRDLAELGAHARGVHDRAPGAEHRGAAGEDEALDVGDRRRVDARPRRRGE